MAASSSGEGFWFSDSHRSHDYHHHHLHQVEDDVEDHPGYDHCGEEGYFPFTYGDPSAVNWEERCVELEMSLQRFRDQAGKIRGLLREKVIVNAIFYLSVSLHPHAPVPNVKGKGVGGRFGCSSHV